jgi:hypothetical protein
LLNTEFAEFTQSLPKLERKRERNPETPGPEKGKSGRVAAALLDTWYYPAQIVPEVGV